MFNPDNAKAFVNIEEISSPPSLLRKIVSSIVLSAYLFSFILFPVYASTADIIPPLPSRFHGHSCETGIEGRETHIERVAVPLETPLQHQFRLWSSLPPLMRKALSFDTAYQPEGWSTYYQLSLGFEDTHGRGVFNIPGGKPLWIDLG